MIEEQTPFGSFESSQHEPNCKKPSSRETPHRIDVEQPQKPPKKSLNLTSSLVVFFCYSFPPKTRCFFLVSPFFPGFSPFFSRCFPLGGWAAEVLEASFGESLVESLSPGGGGDGMGWSPRFSTFFFFFLGGGWEGKHGKMYNMLEKC